ncbi:MAG: helix-turn-helix domain-containing protein [Actinomycetota bacterium]|nr:helix-turn-helix domain-containing protein [Actinomycetota bacterium]
MTAIDPQELLTPDEVCALLKMKRTWFYAQVACGVFRPIKLGRSTRVRRRDLEAYLSGLEHVAPVSRNSAGMRGEC